MFPSYQNLCIRLCTIVTLCVLLHLEPASCRQTVRLETVADLKGQWKVEGDYLYVPTGHQLSDLQSSLPNNFHFKDVSNALGVWIILPSVDPTNEILNMTTYTNIVTFSFAASAQLFDSVTITHNSGGNKTEIRVIASTTTHILTPRITFQGWAKDTTALDGTSRFSIQAITHEKGADYILIDQIEAVFVETTTSSRRPRTSTPTPAPQTSDGTGRSHQLNYVLLAMACFLLKWSN